MPPGPRHARPDASRTRPTPRRRSDASARTAHALRGRHRLRTKLGTLAGIPRAMVMRAVVRRASGPRSFVPLALSALVLGTIVVAPNLAFGARAHAAARVPLPLPSDDVVLQSHPEGCGAALLATLLARLGRPVGEAELLAAAPPGPDGISLATFASLAGERGLLGSWRRSPRGTLPSGSYVAHLERPEGHFVWVEGRAGPYLHVVDPAHGEVLLHQDRFAKRFSGRYFLPEDRS